MPDAFTGTASSTTSQTEGMLRVSSRAGCTAAIAALAHSDEALASPELKTALADPVTGVPPVESEVNVSPLEASDECVLSEDCIEQYLWSVYERARKVDTIKVQERIKATVTKNGKSRTVTKTITKLVDEDFTQHSDCAARRVRHSRLWRVTPRCPITRNGMR